jgi:prepilin signal peptidase PulO-like enzyme (type II secretory pathway)
MVVAHLLFWSLLFGIEDIRSHRISQRKLLLAIITLTPFITQWALVLAFANLSLYLMIFLLSRGALGFGDVKLSFLIGAYFGLFQADFMQLILLNFLAWAFASMFLIGKWVFAGPVRALPFAPFLFFSGFLAVLTI